MSKTHDEDSSPAGSGAAAVRPGLRVIGCCWGGLVWMVTLHSPAKIERGTMLYSDADLAAAVAAERERWALKCEYVSDGLRSNGRAESADALAALAKELRA